MSLQADAIQEINEIARSIAERFSPEKIILFGSRARGDAREDSDIDLLVLFSDVENPQARAAEVYSALVGCSSAPKDI